MSNKTIEALAMSLLTPPKPPSPRNWREQAHQQQQMYGAAGSSLSPHAMGSVDGAASPVFFRQRGFNNTIARTSAGIYVLTMLVALDIAGGDGIVMCGNNGTFAVGATAQASPTSATTVTVTLATLTAGPVAAAADIDFWILIWAIGPN